MKPWLVQDAWWVLLLAIVCAASMNCAPKFHVQAELDQALPTIPPNAVISVQRDREALSSVDADVAGRIEQLLQQMGYEIASAARADYALLFDFGTNRNRAQLWRHYMTIALIDARLHRRTRESLIVWKGWVELDEQMLKNPRKPEELLDLFLVALLEHFPEDTGGFVKVSVTPDDPRVKALRGEE